MEPESSSPYSQDPVTGLEPDESNLDLKLCFIKTHFNIILSSKPRSPRSGAMLYFSSPIGMLHIPVISSSLISSP